MQGVGTFHVRSLIYSANDTQTQLPDGRWVPARPIGMWGLMPRLRAAWRVFTGKADVLVWDGEVSSKPLKKEKS